MRSEEISRGAQKLLGDWDPTCCGQWMQKAWGRIRRISFSNSARPLTSAYERVLQSPPLQRVEWRGLSPSSQHDSGSLTWLHLYKLSGDDEFCRWLFNLP